MRKFIKLFFSVVFAGVISLTALVGCVNPNIKFVKSIEQTSVTDTGVVYTITYSDDTTSTFTVNNGQNGSDGRSIISVEKTSTQGKVDTYTIYYSDNTTSNFTITNGQDGASGTDGRSIISVEKTSTLEGVDTYTIYYSDNTTSNFTVTNGKDGASGQNGKDFSITEVYDEYNKTLAADGHAPVTFEQFLEKFLSSPSDSTSTTASCLLSSLALYSEFIVHNDDTPEDSTDAIRAVFTGSGVIYRMDSDYTYVLTNFHVVYSGNTNTSVTNGNCFARRVVGYLYGSEGVPVVQNTYDQFGYHVAYSGNYLEFTLVGTSVSDDIALIKVPTASVLAMNENAKPVTLAQKYFVGETAIAIGDANSEGISVTKGIVSVDSEYIALAVDDISVRTHRVMRIDTTIYPGNSGCGLFNDKGELIGICNSGATEESINYAIPVDVVAPVARNIYHYHKDGNDFTNGLIICPIGLTVNATSSKYQYDLDSGYGSIVETVMVSEITSNSLASKLGLAVNDKITHFYINDTAYKINRTFNIYDIVVSLRAGDSLKVTFVRNGTAITSSPVAITTDNLYYASV